MEGSGRSTRTGADIGLFGQIPITPWLAFRPELDYLTKGSHDSAGNLTQLAYLDVPLLFEIRVPFHGGRIFLPFGPGYGILVGQSEVSSTGAITQIQSGSIAHNELAMIGGIGAALDVFGRYSLFILARYDYGLTNVARFQIGGQSPTYYSRNLSILIGISRSGPLSDDRSY